MGNFHYRYPLSVLNVRNVTGKEPADEPTPPGPAPVVDAVRFTNVGDGVATVGYTDGASLKPNFQYRRDVSEQFQDWNYSDITLQPGEYVEVIGENNSAISGQNVSSFSSFSIRGSSVTSSGNIMSLIYGINLNEENELVIPCDYMFFLLFYRCTSLISAPNLPATTLTYRCYGSMFLYCSKLLTAPKLPATTLTDYCYSSMFSDCTSLFTAPELPASTLVDNCYSGMFSRCTSLINAPELTATTLAENCYSSMFLGCNKLTKAPKLPAEKTERYCYSAMFYGCTSLTDAPDLPATTLTLYCYSQMFQDCSLLTSAPQLPAVALVDDCYRHMFKGCTQINKINVAFNRWVSSYTTFEWLKDVSPSGTFICPEALEEKRGESYIPEGWTIERF